MIRFSESNVVWFDLTSDARVGRSGDEVVIEWPGLLRLAATPEMERARLKPLRALDDETIRKTQGFARAFPAYLRGAVVFHGAAVCIGDRGLLVIGASGAGKSTTAAVLCAEGARLIADDTTVGVLEGDAVFLQPLEAEHWLDEPSRRALGQPIDAPGKRPVAAQRSDAPVRLHSVVLVEPRESPAVESTQLRGLAAAGALLESALRLPLDAERSKRDLDTLARIARRVPVHRVLRPREFSSNLKGLSSALLDLVARA